MAISLTFVLLLAAAIGSSVDAARITQERRRAEAQAKKSQEVARFLKEMLAAATPARMQGLDATTMMRKVLQQAENRLNSDLKEHPDVQAELRETIGTAYLNLLEFAKAEVMLREAARLREILQGAAHPETINAKFHLMESLWVQRKRTESDHLLHTLLPLHIKVNGSNNVRTAELLNFYAYTRKDHQEAEPFNRRALAILQQANVTNDAAFGLTLQNIAHHLLYQDRLDEAASYARQAVTTQRRLVGNDQPATAYALHELALILTAANRFAEAATTARESWEIHKKFFGLTNQATLAVFWLLGVVTFESDDVTKAEALLATAPFDAIDLEDPESVGRTVGEEYVRFWLIRTLTALAWQNHLANPTSARRYAHEATRLARAYLVFREKRTEYNSPWRLANAQSLVGGAVLASAAVNPDSATRPRLAMLQEAESLLLQGYAGLDTFMDVPLRHAEQFRREAVERIIRLYELWDTLVPGSSHAKNLTNWKSRLSAVATQAAENQIPPSP